MSERLIKAIKAFEDISNYKYDPHEPYFTFTWNQYNITFDEYSQIHTGKGDIQMSKEWYKWWGWHRLKQSLGTYLVYAKWLPAMIELSAAIKEHYNETN